MKSIHENLYTVTTGRELSKETRDDLIAHFVKHNDRMFMLMYYSDATLIDLKGHLSYGDYREIVHRNAPNVAVLADSPHLDYFVFVTVDEGYFVFDLNGKNFMSPLGIFDFVKFMGRHLE